MKMKSKGGSRCSDARTRRHGCWTQRLAFGKLAAPSEAFGSTGTVTINADRTVSAKNPGGEVRAQLKGN
jgi:hypothetical protein